METIGMAKNEWHIENVSPETKRRVKAFAASLGITIGEAVTRLADLAKI